MQSSFQQSPQFIRNTNKISLSPKNQSSHNMKMMSTKYCLNKPKLFKEFKQSSLFQHSKTTFNLHQYSQRYTYNQRIDSFEKQNHNQSIKHYNDGDKSINVDFVKEKILKMSKSQIMKRKVPKTADQNCLKRSKFQISIKRTQSNQILDNSCDMTKLLSLRVDKNKQKQQKSYKVYNRKFLQQFPNKNEKQVLMSYIKKNPLQFSPIKLNQLKQNDKKLDSLRKLNLSTRKLGQRTNVGSKWNLSTKKLRTTNKLSEEDQKYERQKMKLREQIFVLIDDQIKKMFDLISQLKSLGYVEEKISEWIWTYCENNKKFLQQIIFKPEGYRSSLTDPKVVHKLEDVDQAKLKARNFQRVINNISIDLHIEDISELTNYLEQILISRQYFQLKRIQNQIQDTKNVIKNNYQNMKDEKAGQILKMVNSFDQNKKFKPLQYYQMLSFYQDAKRIESHFGRVKGLTPGNKRKFEDLNDVELQLNRKPKEVQE